MRSRVEQNRCDNRSLIGFECRRQAGVGYFRDAAELAALKPRQLYDLFRDLPGIRMSAGRGGGGLHAFVSGVRPSRCLKVLVNGRPQFGSQWWTEHDVVGIEYYDDHRKVPLDYRQIADTGICKAFYPMRIDHMGSRTAHEVGQSRCVARRGSAVPPTALQQELLATLA